MFLREDYDQRIDPVTGAVLRPRTYREATASFHPMIPFPRTLADLIVNDTVLNQANDWRLWTVNDSAFQTHFEQGATSNTLRKDADAHLGAIDTAVTFG